MRGNCHGLFYPTDPLLNFYNKNNSFKLRRKYQNDTFKCVPHTCMSLLLLLSSAINISTFMRLLFKGGEATRAT
jgi:hypothetical protein